MARRSPQRGFTMVEMIIAITLIGVLSSMVAVFVARPIQGYLDTARRAELTGMADAVLKRMSIELRNAIPGSVRPVSPAAGSYIEFIPALGGGRYCSSSSDCSNPMLNFGTGATTSGTFDVLGPLPSGMTANSDRLIIYNTGLGGLDAYTNDNCAKLTNSASPLTYTNATPFPFDSPSHRFFVAPASGPVRFNCTATAVQRIGGSSNFCGLTPTSVTSTLASADSIVCAFRFSSVSASNGLLTLSITLTSSGESVTLINQIHVDNLP